MKQPDRFDDKAAAAAPDASGRTFIVVPAWLRSDRGRRGTFFRQCEAVSGSAAFFHQILTLPGFLTAALPFFVDLSAQEKINGFASLT
jgi:hypothetical protein